MLNLSSLDECVIDPLSVFAAFGDTSSYRCLRGMDNAEGYWARCKNVWQVLKVVGSLSNRSERVHR